MDYIQFVLNLNVSFYDTLIYVCNSFIILLDFERSDECSIGFMNF